MSIFKRGEVWWCDIKLDGRPRTRVSTGTTEKRAAQEFHDRLKSRLWREAKLGERVERTWDEAALRWLKERAGKRDYDGDCSKIEFFGRYFAGKRLRDLTDEAVANAVESGKGHLSPATRNRYYALIRSILRRAAVQWKWISVDEVPYLHEHEEPPSRRRYLEPEEYRALIRELPPHLRDVMKVAVATGLRASNVTGLTWDRVNLDERVVVIPGSQTKNGQDLILPLNDTAASTIAEWKGKHPTHVFCYRRRPIRQVSTHAWAKAKKRAGVRDFRFHDNRHTFASWLGQAGVAESVIQELGGWKDRRMVKAYTTLAAKHLAPAAAVIDRISGHIPATTTGTLGHSPLTDDDKTLSENENLGWLMGLEPTTTGITSSSQNDGNALSDKEEQTKL